VVSSRLIYALLVVGVISAAQLLAAAETATQPIDIPAQDLGTALIQFARLTHHQIAFDNKLVAGHSSTALSGTYTPADGLRALIGPAPFVVRVTRSGVLTVAAEPQPPGERNAVSLDPRPSQAADTPAGTSDPVIVSARRRALRAELEPKLHSFVNGTLSLAKGEGVAAWRRPVCPLVAGLPQLEGEFILARLSEVARVAGVPLAGENCRPNLYILVNTRPKELLQGMEKRNWVYTFGADAYPLEIDEFINTPRTVRAWYDIGMADRWDQRPEVTNPSVGESQTFPVIQYAQASHLLSNVRYRFLRVFVIVDRTRLQGVSRGQLADYIAMVGFADIDPNPRLRDAPTILRLFCPGAATSAPSGLTAWDEAYLKSIYGMTGPTQLPRAYIAHRMVSELVP
jgi:hypothetical protein